MHAVRLAVAGLLVLGLTVLAGAQEKGAKVKVSKDKLVGTWEMVKADKAPPGSKGSVEFTSDGKMIMTFTFKDEKGKPKTVQGKGTYKIKAGGFTSTITRPDGKTQTSNVTITKLTDKELETKGKDGELALFKRVAAKSRKKTEK
jgi:uncharacterized protein (TIGR03066 family)